MLTTSLGLGSGDFLPGLDLHLNSMLGEVDLLAGAARAGRADGEHDGAVARARRATGSRSRSAPPGGTRLRTALVTVAAGILDEGLEPQAAVDRPRFHPAGDVVNAEPGVDEDALAALEAAGRTVRRWPERHHYFGGVSASGEPERRPTRAGAARRAPFRRQADRDPADVAAGRAARVLSATVPPAAGFA